MSSNSFETSTFGGVSCPIFLSSVFFGLLLSELYPLSFLPEFLNKRIRDAVSTVTSAPNEICVEELVYDQLDFFGLDVAPEHRGILSCSCCGEEPHCITLGPCDAIKDRLRQPNHVFHFYKLNFHRHASDAPGDHREKLVWVTPSR